MGLERLKIEVNENINLENEGSKKVGGIRFRDVKKEYFFHCKLKNNSITMDYMPTPPISCNFLDGQALLAPRPALTNRQAREKK